jgi:hypothetical protein
MLGIGEGGFGPKSEEDQRLVERMYGTKSE